VTAAKWAPSINHVLLYGFPRNSGAAGKRVIAKGRLPVPSNNKLRTIQKLRSVEESIGEVSAIEHRFEKVRVLQVGTREVRPVQVRPSEIGAPKINPGKIESAQVEASQTGPR
jgi:hypothetical protein